VPRISEFYGIVIAMYYREHGVPHFHATYAGETVVISIATGEVIAGGVSARALRLSRNGVSSIGTSCDSTGLVRVRTRRWCASTRFRSILHVDLASHLHRIVEVEVVGAHRLRLAFDDGAGGEVDASDWDWTGVFEPLSDPEYFARVRLDAELGTISWPNGADVAPETLHLWVARRRDNVSA
jgi:Protein of unknown function (DUF2442)/Domain of unknown function (DUF4160)